MGAQRQTANIWRCIWFLMTEKYWGIRDIKECFQSEYFWQDSFWTHWNRLVGCRILGHRKVIRLDEPNGEIRNHCFNCYRDVAVKQQA